MEIFERSVDVHKLSKAYLVLGDAASLKILYELDKMGERNFTELKEKLHINPATLTKKLRILTEVGLISSDRTHDRLRVYYSIAQHQRVLRKFLEGFERLASEL